MESKDPCPAGCGGIVARNSQCGGSCREEFPEATWAVEGVRDPSTAWVPHFSRHSLRSG